jgi:hypothetical protein
LERLVKDKHSSILQKFENYGRKEFYNIGPLDFVENVLSMLKTAESNTLSVILHEWTEQSKCSEVKGIKKAFKNFTCLYMDGRASVCESVSVPIDENALKNYNTY